MTMDHDSALVERARSGDRDAFTMLVRRHDQMLRALAFRMLGDRHTMDDALQEAYLRAYRSIGSFRGQAAFSTWLYRIVYTSCIDQIRRRRPMELLTEVEVVPVAVEQGLDLARALERLRPEQRAVVMLVDAQGFTHEEAARVMGVPTGTVKSRLSRAHRHLRTILGDAR